MVKRIELPFIRSAYNYDRDEASNDSGLFCPEPTRAQQSFAEECDINTIVRRFHIGGELPVGVRMPTYGDFEGVFDFHSAMNAVAAARESFDRMPAEVRSRFENDPAKFVAFCSDEGNRDEAIKLGLVPPRVEPVAVPPAPPASSGGSSPAAVRAAAPGAPGAPGEVVKGPDGPGAQ